MRHLDTPTAMNCTYWSRHTQSWYETWENLSQNCPHPWLKTKLVVTTLNNELWFPILTWSHHSLPSMTHIKQPKTTSAAMNSVHWSEHTILYLTLNSNLNLVSPFFIFSMRHETKTFNQSSCYALNYVYWSRHTQSWCELWGPQAEIVLITSTCHHV